MPARVFSDIRYNYAPLPSGSRSAVQFLHEPEPRATVPEAETIILVNNLDPSLLEIYTNDSAVAARLLAAGAVREYIPFEPDTLRGVLFSRFDILLVCFRQQIRVRALTLVKRSSLTPKRLKRKVKESKQAQEDGSPLGALHKAKPPRKHKRELRSELMPGELVAARAADKEKSQRFQAQLSSEERAIWQETRRRQHRESNNRARAKLSEEEKVVKRQAEKERQARFWAQLTPEEQQARLEKRRRQQLESLRRRRERARPLEQNIVEQSPGETYGLYGPTAP